MIGNQSLLIYHIASPLLNGVILGSRVIPGVPKFVDYSAQSILGSGSLLFFGITDQINSLKKSFNDLVEADIVPFFIVALKVSVKAVDLFLSITTLIPPVLLLFGATSIGMTFYPILIPISLTSMISDIAVKIFEYYDSTMVARDLVEHDETRMKQDILKKNLQDPMVKRIYRLLDHYDLEMLKQESKTLSKIFELKLRIRSFNTLLQGAGYIALTINRAYPLSVIQAATNFTFSTLYSCKFFYERGYLEPA